MPAIVWRSSCGPGALAAESILMVFSVPSLGIIRVLSRTVIILHGHETRNASLFYDAAATLSAPETRKALDGMFTYTNGPTSNVGSVRTFVSRSFVY